MNKFKPGLELDRNLMICIGIAFLAQFIFLGACALAPETPDGTNHADSNCVQPASGQGTSLSGGSASHGMDSIPSKNFVGGKASEKLGIRSSGMGGIGPTASLDVYGVFWPC